MPIHSEAPFVFILGREPHLSVAEIVAVLGDAVDFSRVELSREALLLSGVAAGFSPPSGNGASNGDPFDSQTRSGQALKVAATTMIDRLAGTQKIAAVVGEVPRGTGDAAACVAAVVACITAHTMVERKVRFGFSVYDLGGGAREVARVRTALSRSVKDCKAALVAGGRKVRHVISRADTLASVTVSEQQLLPEDNGVEVIVLAARDRFVVCRTLAVQPFKTWSRRDYGRPRRDARSGMLPPKLARMMANIARAPQGGTLLDPFCGSGTVLMEAALLGVAHVIGTDASADAVGDARENLAWVALGRKMEAQVFIEHCDVRALAEFMGKRRVDAIVTEPYLGPSRPPHGGSGALTRELLGLYRDAFAQFARVLVPGGRVVFVLPNAAHLRGISPEQFSRDVAALGFVRIAPFPQSLAHHAVLAGKEDLPYAREGQRTARRILCFTFTPNHARGR